MERCSRGSLDRRVSAGEEEDGDAGLGAQTRGAEDVVGNEVRRWLGVTSQGTLFATLRNLAAVEVIPVSRPRASAGVEAEGAGSGLAYPSQL